MLAIRPALRASVLGLLTLLCVAQNSQAAPKTPLLPPGKTTLAIPDVLRPWIGWVLHDKEEELCPFLYGEEGDSGRRCVWPADLSLNLNERGGKFTQRWRVYKKGWVALPGDGKVWPQTVQVDGKAAVVATAGGEGPSDADDESAQPQVLLVPGDHTVSGTFIWDELPESLAVPTETGLLSLSVRGTKLPLPSRDDDGRVWLQKEATEKEEEVLQLTVHRQVTDDVPLLLTTRIELRVSGKSREVLLGRTLPQGFVPLSLQSPLPARLEPDSHLRAQVRAGTWTVTIVGRREGRPEGNTTELRRPAPEGIWADDEVWVFQARPNLRVVTVEGVPLIDPQQTTLPDDWKRLPCYPMRLTDTLKLVEQKRGDAEPEADLLNLRRRIWLDFNGSGYTVSDRITGKLHRAWRMEVNPPMELGRVSVGGADQFITRIAAQGPGAGQTARTGVEIRQAKLDLSADSRIVPSQRGELPVVGWDADFHQVFPMELHLPPGWRLFHASGADDVSGTWVGRWTLLDLFVLLITAMAVARLYGIAWGLLTLFMLGLVLPEHQAPRWVFLAVLVAEALWRLLPQTTTATTTSASWVRTPLRLARLACLIALALVTISFAAENLRAGIYPALEHPDQFVADINGLETAPTREDMDSSAMGKGNEEVGAKPVEQVQQEMHIISRAESPRPESADRDSDGIPDEADRKVTRPLRKSKAKRAKSDDIDILRDDMEPKKPAPMGGKAALSEIFGRSSGLGNSASNAMGNLTNNGYYQQNMQQLDPNSVVQTGPGVPRWSWNRTMLRFSGPVQRDQKVQLWLVSPGVNMVLALVRVALLALLVMRLIGTGFLRRRPPSGADSALPAKAGLVAAAALAVLLLPGAAKADELPSTEILDTLRERLLEPPECHPHCASSSRLQLEVQPRQLRARLEVGAAATTAVPLPGGAQQWLPERVLLDGKPAQALLRTEDGKLWLQVGEGSHQIILDGELPSRETVQIALPLKPHRVEAKTQGWRLDGLHEDGQADDDLQLSRVEGNEADAPSGLQAGTLPPFVRIERDIQIGLKWEVQTRVVRITPTGSAVVLEVPLLPGESVTTPEVRVQGGKALVNMAPGASELSWHSLLQERPELVLAAPTGLPWTEVWRLDVSPIWHAVATGIPVVRAPNSESERRPEWRPWPGEKVSVALRRPDGVAGSTLTIDHSRLDVRPGLRATDATMTLALRSSRGGQHVVTLPEGATLESLTIGGESQPARQDGRRVTLPLTPGARQVVLRWRQTTGLSTLYHTPTIDLGTGSVNALVFVHVPGDRWPLLMGGQGVGPVVLFWGYIPLLILLSFVLARLGLTPLRFHHYLLLTIGLSQVPLESGAVFIGWLLALGWREQAGARPEPLRWWLFDLRQLVLVAWTVAALTVLVSAIEKGLLGHPNMQISGNDSSSTELKFFLDHASGPTPTAWLVSLPLLLYRAAMLLWALWMASALLSWLRWVYKAFGAGGLWLPMPPRKKKEKAKDKDKSKDKDKDDAKDDAKDDDAKADEAPKSAESMATPTSATPTSRQSQLTPSGLMSTITPVVSIETNKP